MSVYPAPLNPTFPIFNINNFYQAGKVLTNYGDQTLLGTLTTSGEVTTGNEIIYGDSTTQREPQVLNITDKTLLIDTNLVTKRYVDDEINIVVADAVAAALENYTSPQVFTYGKATTSLSNSVQINSGVAYINFNDTTLTIQTIYFHVCYYITRAGANTIEPSTNGDYQSQHYYATYQATFYKINGVFSLCKFSKQEGDTLTSQTSQFAQNYTPLLIGTINGRCIMKFGFPSNSTLYSNATSANGWISGYGITIKLLASNPINDQQFAEVAETAGNAYFDYQ